MNVCRHKQIAWSVLIVASGGLLAGCGSSPTVESYHPQDITAQEALEKALTAWQNSQEPGSLTGGAPKIRVADERWLKGAKLQKFEIGEPLDEDGPAKFPVKLTFDGASVPEEEVYVVVGKDPLWVMTKAEFERNAGM
jgi:hypothetical protein